LNFLGKTVLFSSVVDNVSKTFSDETLIFFYCKVNDVFRNTFDAIARSLILQILQADATCLVYLYEKMVTSGERHPSTAKLLSQMLEDILTNHNPIMICVDGLDECEEQERRKFLAVVDAVIRTSSPYPIARFFLTSRKEKDLESSLRSAIRLTIKPSHVEKDIISYIQTQTSKLSEKFGLTIEEGQRVATTVATRPKGKCTLGCHSD